MGSARRGGGGGRPRSGGRRQARGRPGVGRPARPRRRAAGARGDAARLGRARGPPGPPDARARALAASRVRHLRPLLRRAARSVGAGRRAARLARASPARAARTARGPAPGPALLRAGADRCRRRHPRDAGPLGGARRLHELHRAPPGGGVPRGEADVCRGEGGRPRALVRRIPRRGGVHGRSEGRRQLAHPRRVPLPPRRPLRPDLGGPRGAAVHAGAARHRARSRFLSGPGVQPRRRARAPRRLPVPGRRRRAGEPRRALRGTPSPRRARGPGPRERNGAGCAHVGARGGGLAIRPR